MRDGFDRRYATMATLVVLGGCLLWSAWPALQAMADRWARDPRYAHGYFVPMFAVALLWMRRSRLKEVVPSPTAWGLIPVALGAAMQLVAGYFHLEWRLDAVALLPYLAGLVLLVGGRRYLGWAWPSIAFLAFMVPLPW